MTEWQPNELGIKALFFVLFFFVIIIIFGGIQALLNGVYDGLQNSAKYTITLGPEVFLYFECLGVEEHKHIGVNTKI